jgi:hypothetical protein
MLCTQATSKAAQPQSGLKATSVSPERLSDVAVASQQGHHTGRVGVAALAVDINAELVLGQAKPVRQQTSIGDVFKERVRARVPAFAIAINAKFVLSQP